MMEHHVSFKTKQKSQYTQACNQNHTSTILLHHIRSRMLPLFDQHLNNAAFFFPTIVTLCSGVALAGEPTIVQAFLTVLAAVAALYLGMHHQQQQQQQTTLHTNNLSRHSLMCSFSSSISPAASSSSGARSGSLLFQRMKRRESLPQIITLSSRTKSDGSSCNHKTTGIKTNNNNNHKTNHKPTGNSVRFSTQPISVRRNRPQRPGCNNTSAATTATATGTATTSTSTAPTKSLLRANSRRHLKTALRCQTLGYHHSSQQS
mmetsp:Transcript_17978/g.48892  ORF Transcript_17978/g.48892 Transcript_17978/m.48892 type:complete len:261 (+) Transcript_17978:101-883(+)